jgi:hypothetical protein
MTVNVATVDLTARANIRSRVIKGSLLYVAKVRLLAVFAGPPEWTEMDTGYLALSAVGNERAFLTLFEPNSYEVIMIHELYYKFDKSYTKHSPTIYSFPSDLCTFGLQFLVESEAKEMEKQITKSTPEKASGFGLGKLFRGRAKPKSEVVVSMPQDTTHETGMAWDPEKGYEVVGSLQDLPEEHKQFMLGQGFADQGGAPAPPKD